jgi:NAD+ kinase
MRIGLVAQQDNARAAALADELRHDLGDAEVWVDESTAATLSTGVGTETGPRPEAPDGPVEARPVEAMAACDLVVSVGGDGTFLFAARGAGTTPVLGVNLGEVGFLNSVAPEHAVEAVREVVDHHRETGGVRSQELPRVRASGDDWTLAPALNEVAILGPQRGHGNGVDVEIRVDGDLYDGTHADGVLVATPTGSTAYNLGEGGPLVHPSVDALLVTEMCATAPMPPLVVAADSEVTVRVEAADSAIVVADGRLTREVTPPTRVTVAAAEPARIAGPPLEFFAALEKLD